jgi:phage shock protein PspC (stress-responsive transcriptional regulator)
MRDAGDPSNKGRIAMTSPSPTLVRPRRGRIIAGVCAGVADRYGWSRTVVRLAAVASCLLPGPQIVLYLAAWVLMPSAPRHGATASPAT